MQDPQNFLVFLGLEEKGIAKGETGRGPFTKISILEALRRKL